MEDQRQKYAEKIDKLLRKAESTTPEEAEALMAKAEELMLTWAIDQAMIDQLRGKEKREEIITANEMYTGVYHRALYDIGSSIAWPNDLRILVARFDNKTRITVIGFESDVENWKILNASLQIQAMRALSAWWKTKDTSWYSAMDKFKSRRDFLFGFASGVQSQLYAARHEAEKAAAELEAARSEVDTKTASESVSLVLASRKQQVNAWVDKTYGKMKSARPTNYSSSYDGSNGAGYKAGKTADVGRPQVGAGSRAALNA